jgi:uncharacterized protein YacL
MCICMSFYNDKQTFVLTQIKIALPKQVHIQKLLSTIVKFVLCTFHLEIGKREHKKSLKSLFNIGCFRYKKKTRKNNSENFKINYRKLV